MNRAVGAEGLAGDGGDPFAEGHAPAGNGKRGGFEYNCSCSVREALLHDNGAAVRAALAIIFAGSADSFPAQSRQREASESDSSTTERSARAATRWVHGPRSADPHAAWRRSVRPTPCGGPPSVRSAILPGGETERQRSVASGKWPCSRLLPIVLAGRSLAAYYGVLPVRSIAGYCRSWPDEVSRPFCFSGAHELF